MLEGFSRDTIGRLLIGCLLWLGGTLAAGEVLYNGIELPDVWPPKPEQFSRETPQTPPYLSQPPDVIPIDVGRQLFVDDFLIAETNLERKFHQPTWHPATPVLTAERFWEKHGDRNLPFAAPFSDGVWFDPRDQKFKLWYQGGSGVYFCYATSNDGIRWDRPDLNQLYPDSNVLKIEPIQRDSSTVWLDLDDPDPQRRFKLVYFRSKLFTRFSADGIRWSEPVAVHETGDRTTLFRNPFRDVWVYSIRGSFRGIGRCRYYAETNDLTRTLFQDYSQISKWACADKLDRVRNINYVDERPDLYNLDATPYESLMLGLFTIHSKISEQDRPKLNHVTLGYSRDGFHWHRPDRRPFLDVSDDPEAWNYGNVQSAGGGCLVVGDSLYFYCSGRNSRKAQDDGSGGSTGLAVLRRDGFASLSAGDAPGTMTTRPVRFAGKRLFVNLAAAKGTLQVEVLDQAGRVVAPFTRSNSLPIATDATLTEVRWKGADDLSSVAGKPVRFRFTLRNGELYSFWVSDDEQGASGGYVAGGGPGYTGHRDTAGRAALLIAADELPSGVELIRDIPYWDETNAARRLDLALPSQRPAKPQPAMVIIHGGGWIEGDKSSFSTPNNRPPGNVFDFAKLGFVAATINYRMSKEAPYPAALLDCKCAVRWLRANAEKYHIDPDRIGVWGNSAGGHLAVLLALTNDQREFEGDGPWKEFSSRVQCAVSDSGPIDLVAQFEQGTLRGVVDRFLAGPPEGDRLSVYRRASPSSHVHPKVPPLLLIYGVDDNQIPIATADRFVQALDEAGVKDVSYHRLAKVGHCPHSLIRVPWVNDVVNEFCVRTLQTEP